MQNITLDQFYEILEKHDWLYYMSDDSRVYNLGERAEGRIEAIARQSPKLTALHDAFKAYIFSGPTWGKEPLPKPKKPSETTP